MIYFYTAPKDNDFNEKTEIATTFLKRFRIFNHRYKLNIMKIMHYLEILSTAISIISLIIVIYGAVIVLEPGLNELAILGGIVVLRTVLSIFLNKEIRELQSQKETN